MHKQLAIWRFIGDSLKDDIAVMLLYVVHSSGSSPGRRGFFMAVNANANMKGSIGGGIMEHKFVEMAKAKLAAEKDEVSIHKQIHDKSASSNQSGMICSGEQTVLIYRITGKDLHAIRDIINCLEVNGEGYLHLSNEGIQFDNNAEMIDSPLVMDDDFQHWRYTEKLGYTNRLYIIGGGHCALALSKIMCMMDFYIHLIDDRKDLNTFEQNDFVHEKQVVKDYTLLNNIIPSTNNTYVVIMTMGYRTDDLAIRALQGKAFKYMGVLGSAKKMEKMLSDYRQQGLPEAWLSSISAPAGLPVKSQTPEEIAISIAAEIIKIKNSS